MSEVPTWDTALAPSTRALLIVNSQPSQIGEIERVVDALDARLGTDRLWAIAPAVLRSWLIRRGLEAGRVLPARIHGLQVELGYFLESERALCWALAAGVDVVVGSEPYAPWNAEVKADFERRVAPMLGRARYVAQSLPDRRVFVWTADELWQRASRPEQMQRYQMRVTKALARLHEHWKAHGDRAWSDADYDCARDLGTTMFQEQEGDSLTASSDAVASARRYGAERLEAAMKSECAEGGARTVRLLADPPRPSIEAARVPAVSPVRRPAQLARGPKWRGTRLVMRGPIEGPYSYLVMSRPASLRAGDGVFAEGRVYRGGVTIGLVKDAQWASKVDVDDPCEFKAVVAAREAGRHALVVANCVKGGEGENAVVLRRFGWMRRS